MDADLRAHYGVMHVRLHAIRHTLSGTENVKTAGPAQDLVRDYIETLSGLIAEAAQLTAEYKDLLGTIYQEQAERGEAAFDKQNWETSR